jgi:Mn-dependent DtxR family transcriptional regulator
VILRVMQRFTGLELTPRKVSYLKYLVLSGGSAKISEIAAHAGVDPSTATRMVQELSAEGFVAHEPYGRVRLTPPGSEYGRFLLRRHRIIGLILSHYGFSGEEACEEASRIECYLSRSAINRMCRSLGHPTTGLCGEICHDPLCER